MRQSYGWCEYISTTTKEEEARPLPSSKLSPESGCIVERLLQINPKAASTSDHHGFLPLHFELNSEN